MYTTVSTPSPTELLVKSQCMPVDDGTAVIDCVVRHDGVSGYDLVLPPPHAREGDYVRVMGKVVSQRDGRGLGNAIISELFCTMLVVTVLNAGQSDVVQKRRY